MECGFFHPDRGYWQTITEPSAELMAEYPDGTIEIPIKPGVGYEWVGGEWVLPDPPSPEEAAAQELAAEREGMICSAFQARAALHMAGLLDAVEAIMSYPETDPMSRLAWDRAVEFRRDSPTIAAIAGVMGISDTDLDDLFRNAIGIEA